MLIVVGSSENIIGHFLHVHNYDHNQMKPTELYNDLAVRLFTAELLLLLHLSSTLNTDGDSVCFSCVQNYYGEKSFYINFARLFKD